MAHGKGCVVADCGEPATANCASGRCFCATHSTCGECHVILANGELQRAFLRLGGMSEESIRRLLDAKKLDTRAKEGVDAAIERAIQILNDNPGLRLRHGPGDLCRLPHPMPKYDDRQAATSQLPS